MLNEFYEFIAKKVNSFFQKAASDGTLLKGESFCLKLDNDDMVAKVSSALKHLAEENKIIGIYELVCRDNSVYKTYTLSSGYDAITVTHKSQQYSMVIQEYLKLKGVWSGCESHKILCIRAE